MNDVKNKAESSSIQNSGDKIDIKIEMNNCMNSNTDVEVELKNGEKNCKHNIQLEKLEIKTE